MRFEDLVILVPHRPIAAVEQISSFAGLFAWGHLRWRVSAYHALMYARIPVIALDKLRYIVIRLYILIGDSFPKLIKLHLSNIIFPRLIEHQQIQIPLLIKQPLVILTNQFQSHYTKPI